MHRLALALLLVGCAYDDTADHATAVQQAPLPQLFDLEVDGSNGGNPLSFSVSGAPANTAIRIVRAVNGATTPGPCPPQLGGECLDIDGPNGVDVFGFTLTTDGNGGASRTLTLPAGVSDGTAVSFQAIAPAYRVGSNTVDFVTAPLLAGPCAQDDAYEPNDDAFNDPLVTPAASFTGYLCYAANWDWYVFDLEAGETLNVDVTHVYADGDLDIWVFDEPASHTNLPGTITMSGTTSDDEAIAWTAPVDGPIYVAVFNWSNEHDVSSADTSYGFSYGITPAP